MEDSKNVQTVRMNGNEVGTNNNGPQATSGELTGDFDCFGRPGSQIDEKTEFKDKFGQTVRAYPVIVDFRRILQLGQISDATGVICGVSNRDLLHAVIGLYDVSLSDMDAETLYETVCAKWARTIVLVQDMKDAVDDMTERNVKRKSKKEKEEPKEDENTNLEWMERIDEEKDEYKATETTTSAFIDVYSDTDDEDDGEEEEEESEDEDFSKGIHTFIKASLERRKRREAHTGIMESSMIGIENRLLGCATFEKKFIQHKERVIHLTLISVRPRFRNYRIGSYLLSKCVSQTVVGHHEAVVVHADNSAVEFFRKYGFSDDVILNSKWGELADAFTNCTLMSFLPAFSGHVLLPTTISKEKDPDLYEIDQEIKIWQTKSRDAYQGQLCCTMRLRNEILQLKHLVQSQNQLLNKLISDHDKARREKLQAEKDLLSYRLETARQTLTCATEVPVEGGEDLDTRDLIEKLEGQVNTLTQGLLTTTVTEPPASPPEEPTKPVCASPISSNADIIMRFTQGMDLDRSIAVNYNVTSVLRAPETASLKSKFESCLGAMKDPAMVTELYYCGSLEKPTRLPHILSEGFSEEDFAHGEFGRGLYFSKYPSKAAQFSALGKLMEVRVGLGNVETVMRYDRTRKEPSEGNDSIISPGRLYRPGDQGEQAMLSQEYIIFNVNQVLPSCIISYSAYPS